MVQDGGGPLLWQYNETTKWLKQRLAVEYIMDGFNPSIEKWEIPLDAIKEALTNSICHRNHYDTAANIMVELYNDRLEITNPGGLLPKEKPNANRIFYFRFGVTLEHHLPNWQRYSKSRNGPSKETLPIFEKQTRLCDKVETKAGNGLSVVVFSHESLHRVNYFVYFCMRQQDSSEIYRNQQRNGTGQGTA